MKKKLLIFFFLFTVLTNASSAEVKSVCNNKLNQEIVENIGNLKIKKIEVNIDNYRQWTRNSLNILIGNFRWVPEKYKRRFNANVVVNFDDKLVCTYRARVRHSGDQKDHISLKGNSIIQSIDVHLESGNIYGITKFKLLRSITRGNFEDEMFLTEILRELNYIAPRTNYISTKINEVDAEMIFQEKAAKEMLEFNKRREGPILEGDERFLFSMLQDMPDDNLDNNSNGTIALLEKGIDAMFTKQTNSRWINKGKNHSIISYNSLSNLNLAYLLYTNKYKDDQNNFIYYNYNLDNNFLGLNDPDKILRLDTYNLLIYSANGWHGLTPNNRKFYWNSIENFFEPINYDSNANIDADPDILRLPVSKQIALAFGNSKNLLNEIDIKTITKNLNFRGLNINESKVKKKLDKMKKNLNKLKSLYSNIDTDVLAYNNNNKIDENMWNKYYESMHKINPAIYYVKQSQENNSFKACKIKPLNCIDHKFSNDQLMNLIEGQLIINNTQYQYLGENAEADNLLNPSNYKKINFKDTNFYYDKNIEYFYDKNKNEFNIFQSKPGARAFFYKGILKDININFHGYKNKFDFEPPNYPIDERGLTGCISLIHLEVQNINIKSNISSCEDAVNLINVEGSVNEIDIKNSYSDGLDVDFSKIEINNINISNSGNDCVDFSAGHYKLNELKLINCGDKALSVGEKSFLILNKITAEKSDMGIASKDSSITKLNTAYFNNLKICISAYNKKQEFHGGFMEIKNIECKNYNEKMYVDNNSKITLNKYEF